MKIAVSHLSGEKRRNSYSEDCSLSCAFVTTVYNGAAAVERAVMSGLNQHHRIDEYIVVDDGSNDGTWAVVERLAHWDKRIRAISAGRVGRGAALNLAIANTSCNLVFIQDADDFSFPNRVGETLKIFTSDSKIGVVASGYRAIDVESGVETVRIPATEHERILAAFSGRVPLCHTTSAFRKVAWVDGGGYPESGQGIVDMPFWLSIARTAWQFYGSPTVVGTHHYYRSSSFHALFKERSRAALLFKYNLIAFFTVRASVSNLAKGAGRFFSVMFLPSRLRWRLRSFLLHHGFLNRISS